MITPSKVQDWKRSFITRAGDDPVKQRTARISVNSTIRRAKSLFAPDMVKHLETVRLPDPSPFTGIKFEPRQTTFYRSSLDIETLVDAAREDLSPVESEAFKVFLLAVMVGLRRREIDLLEWSASDGNKRLSASSQPATSKPSANIPTAMSKLTQSFWSFSEGTGRGRRAISLLSQP